MPENDEIVAALITAALLRNAGIKETRLAVEKYLNTLSVLQSLAPASAAAPADSVAADPAPAE